MLCKSKTVSERVIDRPEGRASGAKIAAGGSTCRSRSTLTVVARRVPRAMESVGTTTPLMVGRSSVAANALPSTITPAPPENSATMYRMAAATYNVCRGDVGATRDDAAHRPGLHATSPANACDATTHLRIEHEGEDGRDEGIDEE